MGDVYLAEDTRLDRKVAIKVLQESSISDDTARQRLIREARAAAKLDHPNICAIHEVGEDRGSYFIVMQYVEGQTLADRLKNGPIGIDLAVDISIQIADALAEAHSRGIVHRDIKPHNIMITARGLVRVLDFGLAKLVQQSASTDSDAQTANMTTAPGAVVGTLAYMAPEQLRGEVVDARADIFSLGAVIYELLTGQRAFVGQTEATIAAYVLMKEPARVNELAPDAPALLSDIVERALSKSRDDRYQTARDLISDLRLLSHPSAEIRSEAARSRPLSQERTAAFDLIRPSKVNENTGALLHAPTVSQLPALTGTGMLLTRRKMLVLGILLLVIALALVLKLNNGFSARSAVKSIAVLPFTGTAPDEYVVDSLSDSLTRGLSQLTDVKVIASSSVERYRNLEIDPRKVGKELDVAAIITTRLTSRGDNIILRVELVDTRDASVIWAGSFSGTSSDLLSLQIDMSRQISEQLQLKLSGQDKARLSKRQTDNPDAYREYLEGRYYWNRRMGGTLQKAIEHYEAAVRMDPNYALAYAGIGECWVLGGNVSAPPSEYMIKAKAATEMALKLDNDLVEAHTTLARIKSEYEWDWAGAESEFNRAIKINPNYATAYEWYANHLMAVRRVAEASAVMNRAHELDPVSPSINTSLGRPLVFAGDYDRAIKVITHAVEMDPGFLEAHFDLGIAYEMKGSHEEAIQEFHKVRAGAKNFYPAWAMMGYSLARQGRRDEAMNQLEQLIAVSRDHHISTYNMAVLYTGLGDVEKAIEWLMKGYEARAGYLIYLRVDPVFASLVNHPGFEQLVAKMKLP